MMVNLYKFLSLLFAVNLMLPSYGKQSLEYSKWIELFVVGPILPSKKHSIDWHKKVLAPYFGEKLKKPLELIYDHKTAELRTLLQSDKTININEENEIGWTVLIVAAVLGYEDIVDLLCEYGANPLLKNSANVFDAVLCCLKNDEELRSEEIARYERIIWLCRVQAKLLYAMPISLSAGRGQSKEKRNEIRDNLQRNLLPVLLGSQITNFKPTTPFPKGPPPFARRLRGLEDPASDYHNFLHAQELLPQQESWASNFARSNKKLLVSALVGSIAASCVLYWYLNSQEPVEDRDDDMDDQLTSNSTNIDQFNIII